METNTFSKSAPDFQPHFDSFLSYNSGRVVYGEKNEKMNPQ